MKFEITIIPQGVSVMKAKTLIDPSDNSEVISERHREATALADFLPRDANANPDMSDPAKVEEAKAKLHAKVKELAEDVAGPDFADIAARVKVAEDERDLARAEATRQRERGDRLEKSLEARSR